ncbi:MAG: coproporphyrinogen III oxidase, partial [Gemmataceae bacterium]|nr:coproporphyrinogen III oxidase [Gemmataceae bacterium]
MSAPAWWEPRAAYIHVPFCAHHCGYCDFAVVAGADHLMVEYVQALISELKQLGQPRPVQTLFIGGGT